MATDGIHGDMIAAGVSTRRLAEALRAIGIEFPAMMADLPSDGVPMVRLGRIPADTADALAQWITSHHQTNSNAPGSDPAGAVAGGSVVASA
jgi:hypothetical protein